MKQQSGNFGRQRQIAFGRYLRELRKRVRPRLTQEQVAKELHINLCEMEKGVRPVSVEVCADLAKKYGVSLEEILERKYLHQLPLLTGIIRPEDLAEDLLDGINPEEMQRINEEVQRYTAFLLLRQAALSRS